MKYNTYKPLKNLRAVALIFCVLEREKKESPRLIIFLYRLGESVTYFPNRTTPRTRQAAHGHEQRLTIIFFPLSGDFSNILGHPTEKFLEMGHPAPMTA